jgi:hypothetical protein
MHETVWVLVVVWARERILGLAGSVTSTTMTSLPVATWLGSVGENSIASTPTRTNLLTTPSIRCSP